MFQTNDSDVYAVIGLGQTGMACIDYLKKQNKRVIAFDTRDHPPNLDKLAQQYPDIPVYLSGLEEVNLNQATHVIVSPGVAVSEPAIQKQAVAGKPVWGDIELFAQAVTVPVIAITGTNAKSTVTTLVGVMVERAGLKVKVGGNIGVPVLSMLQEPKPEVFVLELSSFQLETTDSLQPAVATILNVTPDHLDRYATIDDYQAAKQRIYRRANAVVTNRDDFRTEVPHANAHSFGSGKPREGEFGLVSGQEQVYLAFGEQCLMPVAELSLQGRHEQMNALAALAIGHAFGLPFEPMIAVLKSFQGLPHRCQLVRERRGVRWVNDSKGTNVGATLAAIEGLGTVISGQIVLIAGGVGKGADFTPLADNIEKYVKQVILIGESAERLYQTLKTKVPCSFAASMQEAVFESERVAKQGDSVLLSPACASFDMFKDYSHRGQVFTEFVLQLP